jgi:hypothetical protein
MWKRRAAGVGAAVVAGLLLYPLTGFCLRLSGPDAVTAENCHRVAIGMTRADVEAVFGRPADQERPVAAPAAVVPVKGPCTVRSWFGRDFALGATFDADGRVILVTIHGPMVPPWRLVADLLGL